jgi:hypothetical protein
MLYEYSRVVFTISKHSMFIIFLLHHLLEYNSRKQNKYLAVLFIQIYISFNVFLSVTIVRQTTTSSYVPQTSFSLQINNYTVTT